LGSLPPDEVGSHFVSQYDSELVYADFHLARFFGLLETQSLLENTIVIVTSDHGEQFFEHALIGHGNSVFEEEIHVPLIIFDPAARPGVIDHVVDHRDVMPWVLERLGLPLPEGVAPSDLEKGERPKVAELFGSPRGDQTAPRFGEHSNRQSPSGAEAKSDRR
jgi:arylsulfatase A-like enzyme